MSRAQQSPAPKGSLYSTAFRAAVVLVVCLSIAACIVILSIPTGSLNVSNIYEGF